MLVKVLSFVHTNISTVFLYSWWTLLPCHPVITKKWFSDCISCLTAVLAYSIKVNPHATSPFCIIILYSPLQQDSLFCTWTTAFSSSCTHSNNCCINSGWLSGITTSLFFRIDKRGVTFISLHSSVLLSLSLIPRSSFLISFTYDAAVASPNTSLSSSRATEILIA